MVPWETDTSGVGGSNGDVAGRIYEETQIVSFWNTLKTIGRGVLGEIPGVNMVLTGLDLAGVIGDAVGGETGAKIKQASTDLADGLREAGETPLTSDQQVRLTEGVRKHEERMAEIGLADVQGGRELAKTEIASSDQYVRQTRPRLLRLYGWAVVLLVFGCIGLAFATVFWGELDKAEASFLIQAFQWALTPVLGVFLLMFRIYTGKRTTEKLAQNGIQPTNFADVALRMLPRR